MNRRLLLTLRVVVPSALLTAVTAGSGCVHAPRPPTDTASRRTQNEGPVLEPREDLTFRYRAAADGAANLGDSIPTKSWTEFEASDGSTVRAYQRSFKRPEYAKDFYLGELARASAVLLEAAPDSVPSGFIVQRAVVEFAAENGRKRAAVLELSGSYVSEVTGPSVGHVLAYERWRETQR